MNATEVKHTPGPWNTGSLMTRVEIMPDGWNAPMCIADCHAKNAPQNECERVANARLISAAPELLAALKGIQEVILETYGRHEDGSIDPDNMGDKSAADIVEQLCFAEQEVNAAIAKAEGSAVASPATS